MNITPGELDRRITFEQNVGGRDSAGDPLEVWQARFKRWAKFSGAGRGRVMSQRDRDQMVLRENDVEWLVRQDSDTLQVAPETWSILHRGRRWLIVGVIPSEQRLDGLRILTASRPDLRGASAPVGDTTGA